MGVHSLRPPAARTDARKRLCLTASGLHRVSVGLLPFASFLTRANSLITKGRARDQVIGNEAIRRLVEIVLKAKGK